MVIFVVSILIIGIIAWVLFVEFGAGDWIIAMQEYKKIGSYSQYTPVSSVLDDKYIEYYWYQIKGFKNINQEAEKYLRKVSKSCTKDDLKWLNECVDFIEAGFKEAEVNVSKLFSDSIEKAGSFAICNIIKRCRVELPEYYQGMGCSTCGEAAVMHTWISLRIQQIEKGEVIKPGDLDYIIDAVNEIKNKSK